MQENERHRALLEHLTDLILIADRTGTVLWCNATVRKYGLEPHHTIGRSLTERVQPPDVERIRGACAEAVARPTFSVAVPGVRALAPTGDTRYVDVTVTYLPDAPGVNGLLVVAHEITEDVAARLAQEQALRVNEERLRQVLRVFNLGLFDHDHVNDTLYWAPELRAEWGLSPEDSVSIADVRRALHPDDRERVLAAVHAAHDPRGDGRYEQRYRIVRANGSVRWIDARSRTFFEGTGDAARPVRTVGAMVDVTDRQNAEERAARAQRLEAIGTLAGGIAHDLNNALTPILLMLDLLKEQYPAEAETLQAVEGSATHAADMVRHLLAFAKGSEGRRISVQPQRLLGEMQKIIKGTFPKDISVQLRAPQSLPTVVGDLTQLQQVMLNLCVNARDAMPGGGTLTLTAEAAAGAALGPGAPPEAIARPSGYIVLRVSDTGSGIASDVLERIFEPFFTTKGPESGTGLGLFTVAGIVRSHGGFVTVNSHLGVGSTFSVFLPVEEALDAATYPAHVHPLFRGNGETILCVDDESSVREAARAVLTRLNFKPVLASDGMDGLIQAVHHRATLRAVITDLHMPQMDGLAFVRAMRRALPDLPIIVMSGRMESFPEEELNKLAVQGLIQKPFTQEVLVNVLRTALAGREGRTAAASRRPEVSRL